MSETVCKCGKQLVWGFTKDGKRIPLDPVPPIYEVVDQEHYRHIVLQAGGRFPAVPIGMELVERTAPNRFMVNHFATCAHANDFHKVEKPAPKKLTPHVFFFDTETTGLPRDFKAPASADGNWPRMVQIAWIVTDKNGVTISEKSIIIKPVGFTIPPEAARIHHITQERALAEGMPLHEALDWFFADYKQCAHVVNHNAAFDVPVLMSEVLRINYPLAPRSVTHHCTKAASTPVCMIPGPRGHKWPTLQELHGFLFGAPFSDAHDALVDVRATAKCFWELKRKHGLFKEIDGAPAELAL